MIIVKRIIKVLLIVVFITLTVFLLLKQYADYQNDTLLNFYVKNNVPLFPIIGLLNFFLPVMLLAESFYISHNMNKKQARWLVAQGVISFIITFSSIWFLDFSMMITFDRVEKPTWVLPYIYGYMRSLYLFGFWSILLGTKFRQLKLIGWILEK